MDEKAAIKRIREFNRFYTVILGMLNRNFLDSDFSAADCRVLYELYMGELCSAAEIASRLRIDKSYLSRILKRFEGLGLIERFQSHEDGRSYVLRMTCAGRAETERLIGLMDERLAALVAPLGYDGRATLCEAMDTVTDILTKANSERAEYDGSRQIR